MKQNLFLPSKIKVGYNKRNDTYSKKLAFVVYYDNKGILRQEKSWQQWRNKDIEPDEFDNVPLEGFVLNKKAGDCGYGWYSRRAKIRVYDPRGFEIEITPENLLYILEHCNSIKGKALDSEFVYAWDGKDVVLLPTCSPDYKEIVGFNMKLKMAHITGSKLQIGFTYKFSDNQEYVYTGRYIEYNWRGEEKGIKYWFYNTSSNSFVTMKSVGKRIIDVVEEKMYDDFLEITDKLESCESFSPVDPAKEIKIQYTFEEFEEIINKIINPNSDFWINYTLYSLYGYSYKSYNSGYLTEKFKLASSIDLTHSPVLHQDKDNNRMLKVRFDSEQNGWTWEYKYINISKLKDFYNEFQPCYIQKYLKNGKLYFDSRKEI